MAMTFSPGKVFLFAASNLVGGLLQIWVLYLVLSSSGKEHSLAVLLGDGGLFFFSTSLVVNSVLILIAESPVKPSAVDISITSFAVLGSSVTSIVVYTAVLTNRLGTVAPFHDHIGAQINCTLVALAYAFFVGVRTGYFSR